MRESIDKKTQLKVFNRDKWHCRYCDDAVIFSPILKVFESISPGHGYYHPNGKSDKMLKYFANKSLRKLSTTLCATRLIK